MSNITLARVLSHNVQVKTLQKDTTFFTFLLLRFWCLPVYLSDQIVKDFIDVDLWFSWCFQKGTEKYHKLKYYQWSGFAIESKWWRCPVCHKASTINNNGPCGSPTKREIDSLTLNPLSPNIHIQILQTDLYTFPSWMGWENLIKDENIVS